MAMERVKNSASVYSIILALKVMDKPHLVHSLARVNRKRLDNLARVSS